MSYHHEWVILILSLSLYLCVFLSVSFSVEIFIYFHLLDDFHPWFSFFRGHISSVWCLPRWHGETVSDANVGSVGMVGAQTGQVRSHCGTGRRREWEKTILRFQKKDVEWSWVYKIWTTAKFYTFRWDGGRQGECLEWMGRRRWVRGTVPCYCVYPKIKPGLIVIFTPEDPLGLSSGDVLFFHVQKIYIYSNKATSSSSVTSSCCLYINIIIVLSSAWQS